MPTIPVTGDYLVGPDDQVTIDGGSSSSFTAYTINYLGSGSDLTFTDQGSVGVTSSQAGAQLRGVSDDSSTAHTLVLEIASGADFGVTATGASSTAFGLLGLSSTATALVNDGTFSVAGVALAYGVQSYSSGGSFVNRNQFTVSSAGYATGFSIGDGAADIDNSGTVSITAGSTAIAFYLRHISSGSFVNSGTISASGPDGGLAIVISGMDEAAAPYSITNSGSITGSVTADSSNPARILLTNTGSITGNIALDSANLNGHAASGYDNEIHNSGTITGIVVLSGDGLDLYDGRGGSLHGNIQLGGGQATIFLGDEGETVYGSGHGSTGQIVGGAGADIIQLASGDGAFVIHGGVGDDVVQGGDGDEIIDGGAGNDSLNGMGGTNTVSYGDATSGVTVSLVLQGMSQNTLGAGTDTLSNFKNLIGSAFNDTLTGDAGDNVIDGGGGDDLIDGGGGTNTVSYQSATAGVTVSLTLEGQAQDTRGAGSDTLEHFRNLVGSIHTDVLEGDAGDNVIDGGAGSDTVGYVTSASGVTVSLALQGQAQDTVGAGHDTLLSIENIDGSNFNDVLTGDAGDNNIEGGDGDDVIDGGAGNDVLSGRHDGFSSPTGNDTVSYASATTGVTVSLAIGGVAQDTVGAGLDTLWGFSNLTGSSFNDTLEGDYRNNVLDGGAGTNTVSYAHAASGVMVSLALQGSAQDTLGAGVDTLSNFRNATGSAFNDVLEGNQFNNVLDGGGGVNTVSFAHATHGVTVDLGQQGAPQPVSIFFGDKDTLLNFQNIIGSAFDDTLVGDAGANVLTGGAGTDLFLPSGGADEITDFSLAQHDQIDLRGLHRFFSMADVAAASTQSGANLVIDLGGGSILTLDNVRLSDLIAASYTPIVVSGDHHIGTAGPDTFTFSQFSYLGPTVTIEGGAGTDTLVLTDQTGFPVLPFASFADFRQVHFSSLEALHFQEIYPGTYEAVFSSSQFGSGLSNALSVGGSPFPSYPTIFNTQPAVSHIVVDMDAPGAFSAAGWTFDYQWTPGDGDRIYINGSSGADTITAASAATTINGGGGDDRLIAGAGGDSFYPAWREDILTGGTGADTFVMSLHGGTDIITDFSHAEGDRIDLTSFHLHSLSDVLALASSSGSNTVLDLDAGTKLTLDNVAESALTATDFVLAPTSAAHLDFNGDGLSDFVWRNDGGAVSLWTAKSGQGAGFAAQDLGGLSTDWQLQGGGDLNGDHRADLVWRRADGEVGVWTASESGSGFLGQDLGPLSTNWRFQQAADFDGDGRSDMLWRNTNGDVTVWTSQSAGAGLAFGARDLGPLSTSWHFQGAGDFNGDGRADLLWRNDNGDVGLWTSTGSGLAFAGQDMGYLAPGWKTQAVADFDGDGRADILWRNDDGSVGIWTATGSTFVGHDFGYLSSSWRFQAVGDFNGDGHSDIVWRGDNGSVGVWTATAGALNFTGQDMGPVPPDWRIQADWHST